MKLLMSSCYFPLPFDDVSTGGVQRHISELSRALHNLGHQVMWAYKLEPMTTGRILDAKIAWADWIIAHDWYAFLHDVAKPQIIVFHGWEGIFPPKPEIVQERQRIAGLADGVIHIGTFLEKYYGTHADLTLWGGTNIPTGPEPPATGRALWMGRLEPDTCPEMAITACRMLGVPLTVCGDGTLRAELEIQNPDVEFLGIVANPLPYMRRSEYVFCTGYLSLLDAMACRKIPIVFWKCDLRRGRVMGMPAFIIGSGHPAGVVSRIYSLGESEKRRHIEKNYQFAESQTWENVARKYLQLMEDCNAKRL